MEASDFTNMKLGKKLKILSKSIYPLGMDNLCTTFPNLEGYFVRLNGDGSGRDHHNCICIRPGNANAVWYFHPCDLASHDNKKLKTINRRHFRMIDKVDDKKSDKIDDSGFHEWEAGNLFKLINEKLVSHDPTYTEYQNFAMAIWDAVQLHLKKEV